MVRWYDGTQQQYKFPEYTLCNKRVHKLVCQPVKHLVQLNSRINSRKTTFFFF